MLHWDNLHFLYDLSYTNKINIIQDHLADKLRNRGQTLLKESDEHVEQVHHYLREHEDRHSYKVRKIGSPSQGQKQHEMIVNWNSKTI